MKNIKDFIFEDSKISTSEIEFYNISGKVLYKVLVNSFKKHFEIDLQKMMESADSDADSDVDIDAEDVEEIEVMDVKEQNALENDDTASEAEAKTDFLNE